MNAESRVPPPAGPALAYTWQQALALLEGQMDRQTFDRWLRGSQLVAAGDGVWTIAAPSVGARDWLSHRLGPTIERTASRLAGGEVRLEVVGREERRQDPTPTEDGDGDSPGDAAPVGQGDGDGEGCGDAARTALLGFDPNSAEGGGYWRMGNYATWFWAALVGAVAWRVYELVVADDRRREKTPWTPPRRYSIGELARAVANGRGGNPNRDQIRGRYRQAQGQRSWQPGAFDRLTAEGLARIEWHDGLRGAAGFEWQRWVPGGNERRGRAGPCRSGLRLVYRLSVVTSLPLLTPQQVARLPAEHQVAHERYLARYGLDVQAWEQITAPSLAVAGQGQLDPGVITDAMRQSLTPRPQCAAG